MKDSFARRGMVASLPRWLRGSNGHAFEEFIASCSGCKTFETVWIRRGVLAPTKKFRQGRDRRIYHDCSLLPCRLFSAAYRDRGLDKKEAAGATALSRTIGLSPVIKI